MSKRWIIWWSDARIRLGGPGFKEYEYGPGCTSLIFAYCRAIPYTIYNTKKEALAVVDKLNVHLNFFQALPYKKSKGDQPLKTCKICNSKRIAIVSGKCSDLFSANADGIIYKGYVPDSLGIGSGDYMSMHYCLNCGMIQDQFPRPTLFEGETMDDMDSEHARTTV